MPASPSTEDNGHHLPSAMPNPPAMLESAKKSTVAHESKNELALTSPIKGLAIRPARASASVEVKDQNQPPTAPKPAAGPEDSKNPTDSPTAKDKHAPNLPPKGRLALKDLLNPETDATIQKRNDDHPKLEPAPSHSTPRAHEAILPPSQASVEKAQESVTAVEQSATRYTPESLPSYPGSPLYRPGSPSYCVESPQYGDYFSESPLYRPELPTRKSASPLDHPKFERILCDLQDHTLCTCGPHTKRGRSLYSGITSKKSIKEFCQTSPLYDRNRKTWAGMYEIPWSPSSPGHSKYKVERLSTKFFCIISAIMDQLGNYNGKRVLRVTAGTPLYHREPEGMTDEFSSPTFVIQAEGPSFELPPHLGTSQYARRDRFGFTNITTCIDVVDRVTVSKEEILAQQAIFARQIFNQQPNRKFVRTLVLTENDVQLYHFDHSGTHCSIMAECRAPTFIKIILGLSSLDEEILGLDTSIQWTINPETGRKESGTLTIKDEETKISKTYELYGVDPSFKQFGIIGRGTTCWPIRDKENRRVLIAKDCYRYEDSSCTPEFENLKVARDFDGCVSMVSYEANRGETVNGFGFCQCRKGRARNQIFSRIVMEKHGKNLFGFTSELQLFQAIRDAVLGHKKLFLKGTIHRDIHWSNILLGKTDAWGSRGILIDFDMAKRVDRLIESKWPTGHYQSLAISILRNAFAKPDEHLMVHDWLDELESFFYMTATIMYQFKGPNNYRKTVPPFVQEWLAIDTFVFGSDHLEKNLQFKERWILSNVPADPAEHVDAEYWSPHSLHLLREFYKLVRYMAGEKERIRNLSRKKAVEEMTLLRTQLECHYCDVLYIFDRAIQDLEADLAALEDSDYDDDSQDTEAEAQTYGIKRELEDEDEEDLDSIRPAKRGRIDGVL